MEEEATDWEALDIDDSLLRPCKRHHHSAAAASPVALIPGPAGALQAAMTRMSQPSEEPLSTQDCFRKAVEDAEDDFTLDPWLSAMDFLRQEGLVDGRGLLLTMPLSSIADDATIQRVPLVVGIIKSCTSNGLGDMMVTLKDPTGKVGASIHRKVLADVNFGKHIAAGAVLVLKQVAVFCPSRNGNYLNITPNNVVKVISTICEPPLKGSYLASTVKHTTSAGESSETPSTVSQEVLSGLHRRTQNIMNGLGKDMNMVEHNEEHRQHASMKPDNAARGGQTVGVKSRAFSDSNKKPEVAAGSQSAETHRPEVCNDKSSVNAVKKTVVARASLPQWTDQQLEELFTFD